MVTISTGKILIVIYALSLACAVIAIATEYSVLQSNSSRDKAYGAFLIIGIICLAIVLITELLLNFVNDLKENKIAGTVSLACMVAAGVCLIIACAVRFQSHFPYGWAVASCTLIMEAVLIFSLLRISS